MTEYEALKIFVTLISIRLDVSPEDILINDMIIIKKFITSRNLEGEFAEFLNELKMES